MSAAPSEFHALPLPVGVERRILYHSSYRAIATYGCSMSELDEAMTDAVKSSGAIIKDDSRHNLCGTLDIVSAGNKLIHVLMDHCPNSSFVQVKYWVDF